LQIKLLSTEVGDLDKTVDQLSSKCEELESSEKERFAADEERHVAEVSKLKTVNDQLKESLEALLAPPTGAAKK
jgi:Ca2+-dependent lipid-binding protein